MDALIELIRCDLSEARVEGIGIIPKFIRFTGISGIQ